MREFHLLDAHVEYPRIDLVVHDKMFRFYKDDLGYGVSKTPGDIGKFVDSGMFLSDDLASASYMAAAHIVTEIHAVGDKVKLVDNLRDSILRKWQEYQSDVKARVEERERRREEEHRERLKAIRKDARKKK